MGVACPAGANAAVHSCRDWVLQQAENNDKVLLKLDFSNAFNTVSREYVLQEVRNKFPSLARFAHWCYSQESKLFFGNHTVPSASGVQQGDPLGPLLFALAVQPLAKELKDLGLDICVFYLDDGVLAGNTRTVARALQLVQQRCSSIGLALNVKKCELVLPGSAAKEDLGKLFPRGLLFDEASGNSRVLLHGCFELLGSAIGDKDFCESYAQTKVHTATTLLNQLAEFDDPQVATRLLRNCAGACKVTHITRMTPPNLQADALDSFDSKVKETFSSVSGIITSTEEWSQACLSIKHGGLGLRSAARHSEAAYLASTCSARDLCHRLSDSFQLRASEPVSLFGSSLASYNQKLPSESRVEADAVSSKRQQALSEALDQAAFKLRFDSLDLADQATITSGCQPGARGFWHAVPSGRCIVPASEFREELRYRLCIPDREENSWCPFCDDIIHHSRRCCAGGDRTIRHNGVRNIVFSFCQRAALRPELERPGLLLPARPSDHHSQARPADVYLPCWTGGLPAALDFAITAPQRQDIVSEASRTPLAAATSYSDCKRAHNNTELACSNQGIRFQPMVSETSGAWAPEALNVLQLIAKAVAGREGKHHSLILKEILSSCAVAARKASARAHFKRR